MWSTINYKSIQSKIKKKEFISALSDCDLYEKKDKDKSYFLRCIIFFKLKKYDLAYEKIKLIKGKEIKNNKYYFLRARISEAVNDISDAENSYFISVRKAAGNKVYLNRYIKFSKKNRYPVYPDAERLEIIKSLKFVDEVFLEESLELKAQYLKDYKADCLVMGDDWAGKFDHLKDICEVHYLPRTENVSTTQIIAQIKKYD